MWFTLKYVSVMLIRRGTKILLIWYATCFNTYSRKQYPEIPNYVHVSIFWLQNILLMLLLLTNKCIWLQYICNIELGCFKMCCIIRKEPWTICLAYTIYNLRQQQAKQTNWVSLNSIIQFAAIGQANKRRDQADKHKQTVTNVGMCV